MLQNQDYDANPILGSFGNYSTARPAFGGHGYLPLTVAGYLKPRARERWRMILIALALAARGVLKPIRAIAETRNRRHHAKASPNQKSAGQP